MKILDKYTVTSEKVPVEVTISESFDEYVNTYEIKQIQVSKATDLMLQHLKEMVIGNVNIKVSEILDLNEVDNIKKKFKEKAQELVDREITDASPKDKEVLIGKLIQDMLGLGELELLLADNELEEIVVNSSKEPVWVYHKRFGWLKTNLHMKSEEQIANYASIVGRRVGRQITNLNPLMDAHLTTGDRVNAVVFPISTKGNCLTIRKFAKNPWTIIHMLDPSIKTLNVDVASLLWMCVQYEMNMLISGGTASGKTSFLNAILVFTPPNQRVISIEDTRELYLPEFLHWTPLTTRLPNPEGKGEVTMLDLMINSLRMRPDRIVLGEMRRQNEAEVLFEAMHTGHAVYATIHADDARQTKSRLTTPPINLPESMLGALHLIVVQYRQRRTGIRRTFEVAEVVPQESKTFINRIFAWNPRTDVMEKIGDYVRIMDELGLFAGMNNKEINADLDERKKVLTYMLKNKIYDVNDVGRVVAAFYRDKERLLDMVKKNMEPSKIIKMGVV
ncbi:CpaF family protein [Candidatus Micrarchaeota archaeon]|nr:CpaF family protein [Candidatus Micrarchaeota archaeon]